MASKERTKPVILIKSIVNYGIPWCRSFTLWISNKQQLWALSLLFSYNPTSQFFEQRSGLGAWDNTQWYCTNLCICELYLCHYMFHWVPNWAHSLSTAQCALSHQEKWIKIMELGKRVSFTQNNKTRSLYHSKQKCIKISKSDLYLLSIWWNMQAESSTILPVRSLQWNNHANKAGINKWDYV